MIMKMMRMIRKNEKDDGAIVYSLLVINISF